MNRFSDIELKVIADRIVTAQIGNKAAEPGYKYGFMHGFIEACKFIDRLQEEYSNEEMTLKRQENEQNKCVICKNTDKEQSYGI